MSNDINIIKGSDKNDVFILTKQLFQACINNNPIEMKLLIGLKANPNGYCNLYPQYRVETYDGHYDHLFTDDTPNNSLLHASIISNSIEMVEYVMNDVGVDDVYGVDLNGLNILDIAIMKNNINIVKYIIQKGYFDIQQQFSKRFQFLQYATNIELITYLLDLIDPERIHKPNYFTFARLAMRHKQPLPLIKTLVELYNIDFDEFDPDDIGETLITATLAENCINSNDIELIDYFIINGINIEYPDFFGRTSIFRAIRSSAWDTVDLLLYKYKVNIEQTDTNNYAILHTMAIMIDIPLDLFDKCIQTFGLDVHIEMNNVQRCTPLYIASLHKNIRLVQHIITKYGLSPLTPSPKTGQLTLHGILQSKHCTSEYINFLHQYGQIDPYINKRDSQSRTPLIIAAEYSKLDVIQSILQYNAIIPKYDLEYDFFHLLLSKAAINTDEMILDYFLQHDDIRNHITSNELLQLLFKTIDSYNINVAQLLITKYTVNPLQLSQQHGNISIFQYIIMNNIYPHGTQLIQYLIDLGRFDLRSSFKHSVLDSDQNLLISLSRRFEQIDFDVLQCFVKNGANVQCINENNGMNLLHTMLSSPSPPSSSIIHYLITQCGLDVNQQDYDGQTYLHKVMNLHPHDRLSISRQLIYQYNADVTIIDKNRKTALHILFESRNQHDDDELLQPLQYLLQSI